MNYILFPDPTEVTRPDLSDSSSNDTATVMPVFREDPTTELGYSFVFPEPLWGRKKLPSNAIWDSVRGRYTRRYTNGRVVEWSGNRADDALYNKRVDLKLNGVQIAMDWDRIDMVSRACPGVQITTVDGIHYWPIEEDDLMQMVTKDSCQCAEFLFMRAHGNDKMSRNCRHMKLLLSKHKVLTCDICVMSEEDIARKTDLEIFQFCETRNCDNMLCNTCYTSIMNKSAMCPFCRAYN
jgi:hypothetical protein